MKKNKMIPKFKTAEEKEVQEKRHKKIFAIFVIAILCFSVMAYSVLSIYGDSQTKYNKFNFEQTYEGWKSKVGDFFILTQFHPKEVEDIKFSGEIGDFSNIVYLVSKTEDEKMAAEEINKNLLSLKKDFACLPEYADTQECFNTTIKSCNDASYLEKVIVFQEKESNASISYSNNCLIITGEDRDELLRASDKALFLILGIIK